MQAFQFNATGKDSTVMLLGAHCDDIEIGCGGTVVRLVRQLAKARFVWVVFSSDEVREAEARASATRFLGEAHAAEVRIERFRGSYFPACFEGLKECFEQLKAYAPDLVLTHCRHDLHQDHRVVNELTWNTFRNHAVLEYEIPKFDGDLAVPNAYVPLSRAEVDFKTQTLMECFPSQRARTWFTPDTFQSMARIRGIECNAPEGYAEGFYGRKLTLAF